MWLEADALYAFKGEGFSEEIGMQDVVSCSVSSNRRQYGGHFRGKKETPFSIRLYLLIGVEPVSVRNNSPSFNMPTYITASVVPLGKVAIE